MKDWSDGKRFLFDHIFDSCLYGAMFFCGAFLDPLLNLFHSFGVPLVPNEVLGHPYALGKYQVALLVLSGFQILRIVQKLTQWKYYS